MPGGYLEIWQLFIYGNKLYCFSKFADALHFAYVKVINLLGCRADFQQSMRYQFPAELRK